MRHITSISRVPLQAEQDPQDLTTLINVINLLFGIMTGFFTGTQEVFTAVTTALGVKSTQKAGDTTA